MQMLGIDDLMQLSSIYDFISEEDIAEDAKHASFKTSANEVHIKPYANVVDRNNSPDEPNVNKPIPAIEVGISIDF